MQRQLKQYEHRTDPEILHRIRVELKKIKVLFHLVAFCSEDFKAKREYKPLKKIFRRAGRIRKFDVDALVLHENEIENVEQNVLSEIYKKKKYIVSFKNNIHDFRNIARRYDKKMKKYYAKADAVCLKKYVLHKEKEVQKGLFPSLHVQQLHELRKLVKEILYLSPLNKSGFIDKKYYYSLQEIIGSWHDKQALIQLLKKNKSRLNLAVINKLKSESDKDIKKLKSFLFGKLINEK